MHQAHQHRSPTSQVGMEGKFRGAFFFFFFLVLFSNFSSFKKNASNMEVFQLEKKVSTL